MPGPGPWRKNKTIQNIWKYFRVSCLMWVYCLCVVPVMFRVWEMCVFLQDVTHKLSHGRLTNTNIALLHHLTPLATSTTSAGRGAPLTTLLISYRDELRILDNPILPTATNRLLEEGPKARNQVHLTEEFPEILIFQISSEIVLKWLRMMFWLVKNFKLSRSFWYFESMIPDKSLPYKFFRPQQYRVEISWIVSQHIQDRAVWTPVVMFQC